MEKKVDLNKLKEEISNRQKNKQQTQGDGEAPKDKFLNNLLNSLKTGQINEATNLIKKVNNHTSAKLGEKPKMNITESLPTTKPEPKRNNHQPQKNVDMSQERDEQLWRDFNVKNKTLSESIQSYYGQTGGGSNIGNHQAQNNNQQMLNEEQLFGAVKGSVDKYLSENFGLVVEEAIKSTILEMYAVERIKDVLHENKDLVKTLVYETIREIQEKNKAKKR